MNTPKNIQAKSLFSRLRSQLSRRRTHAWRLSYESSTKGNLSVVFAGREKNKEYIKDVLFNGGCSEKALGRIWKFRLKQIAGENSTLLVTEYDTQQQETNWINEGFMIPYWLGWVADISGDIDKLIKSTRTLSYNLGKIRKNNLEYVISDNLDDFEIFYDTMYLPYMENRYDTTAHLMSRTEMRLQHDICQLLYVKQGQECLSGLLIKYEPDSPRIWSIGVKDANRQYIQEGALGALYHFLIHYLKERGYKSVNFGATRSFLNDGVLNYKKKWPIKNVGYTKQGFQFQLVKGSSDTVKTLANCPFIFLENDKLNCAVFMDSVDSLDSKEIAKICKSHLLNGLDRVVLYLFEDQLKAVEQAIPEDYKSSIAVRSAESLFAG